VREAKEIERLGLTQPPRPPTRGREATELDQARLVRVQLQGELREPLTKLGEEPLRILLILETDDEVVRLCRPADYADRGVNGLVGGVGTAGWSA
jgi:hypothetical protein